MQKHLYHQPLIHARVWDKRIKALGAGISIPTEHTAAAPAGLTADEIAVVEGKHQ